MELGYVKLKGIIKLLLTKVNCFLFPFFQNIIPVKEHKDANNMKNHTLANENKFFSQLPLSMTERLFEIFAIDIELFSTMERAKEIIGLAIK